MIKVFNLTVLPKLLLLQTACPPSVCVCVFGGGFFVGFPQNQVQIERNSLATLKLIQVRSMGSTIYFLSRV